MPRALSWPAVDRIVEDAMRPSVGGEGLAAFLGQAGAALPILDVTQNLGEFLSLSMLPDELLVIPESGAPSSAFSRKGWYWQAP